MATIKYISLVLMILLTGCATPMVDVVPIPPAHPALPPAVHMAPVVFDAITTTNGTYLALTAKNYENLSKNFELLSEHIQQLKLIIWTYRTNDYTKTTIKTNVTEKPNFFQRLFHK